MQKNIVETLIGGVVLIVAAIFLLFAYKSSDVSSIKGYDINAKFNDVSGISLGSDVRVGGIKVGVVSNMGLDEETYQAVVTMRIKTNTKLPKDSSASIVGDGLLGGKYMQLTPGGEDRMLDAGDTIHYTQSAVNLEEMIGKFVFSGGGVDKEAE